ncbi:Cof-type HAD-IIB family hydrolase [Candidatus Saccharibacteria bacterium]|nr:Cof-type HAD-IIB family hydrolase [Candidatus Saccharibacteria bacterium]
MIKGIILDVDGVIVGEKIGYNSPDPNEEVIDKLRSIHGGGIPVILCTAKPHFAITSIIEKAGLNNVHITDGGAVVIDPIDNVILEKHVIDNRDEVQKILNTYLENDVYTEIYTIDDYIIQSSQVSDITDQHTHILQRKPKIVDSLIGESLNSEITKIMPIALNETDKIRVAELFKKANTNLTLSWGVHPVALPLQFGIITAAGISKKQSAIDISKKLDIPFDNMLGVGDSTSDWQFIELCKYAGVMENGSNELKELVKQKGQSNYMIGGHVDENGIIEILDYFVKE